MNNEELSAAVTQLQADMAMTVYGLDDRDSRGLPGV